MANKSVLGGFAAITAFIAVIIGIAAIWLLLAFPLMWAWNYAIPHIVNLKPITWGAGVVSGFRCEHPVYRTF